MSPLFFVLCCLSLSYTDGLFGKDCNDHEDCVSCTKSKSWSGANCRWCPRDSACRAYASPKNKCSLTENIVNHDDCSKRRKNAEYSKNLAYKMVFLSALAYSNDVAKYIPDASEVDTFQLVKQVIKPCSGDADCSGFVAVSHTEKAIAIAFRGTQHFKQLINEVLRIMVEPRTSFKAGGKVEGYFVDAFEVVWNELEGYVYGQMKKYPSYKVWVTGHSLGATMASLASTLIMFKNKTTKDNLTLYTFGQPRVGNYKYAMTHDDLVPMSFRLTHYRDAVVHLPFCKKSLPGIACKQGDGPYHHSREIFYDSEVMIKDTSYEICDGLPYNEDLECSNDPKVWSSCFTTDLPKCIDDHKKYFGVSVGTWWKHIDGKNRANKADLSCILILFLLIPSCII